MSGVVGHDVRASVCIEINCPEAPGGAFDFLLNDSRKTASPGVTELVHKIGPICGSKSFCSVFAVKIEILTESVVTNFEFGRGLDDVGKLVKRREYPEKIFWTARKMSLGDKEPGSIRSGIHPSLVNAVQGCGGIDKGEYHAFG